MKKILTLCFIAFAFAALASTPVKADAVTAQNMVPTFRLMYNVDGAEQILQEKKNILKMYKKSGTPEQKALAQAAVNDATNLLNTLNVLIAKNTELIKAAPAGVVNPGTFAANSIFAQNAWCDYVNKIKYPATYQNISLAENFISKNQNALINQGPHNYPLVYMGYNYNKYHR